MAEKRPAPLFIGDDRALDFLNTVAAPWGEAIEWLADGEDLIAWLEQAGCLDEEHARRLRKEAGFGALDAVAFQARELREWFRPFVARHAGEPLAPAALRGLAPLNQLLERDDAYRQIAVGHNGDTTGALRWKGHRRWRTPESLLLPIAEAMGDLVCAKDFSFVRRCEGPNCTLWFHDMSKSHARRWCSMAVCGNRSKAAAHRARARQRG